MPPPSEGTFTTNHPHQRPPLPNTILKTTILTTDHHTYHRPPSPHTTLIKYHPHHRQPSPQTTLTKHHAHHKPPYHRPPSPHTTLTKYHPHHRQPSPDNPHHRLPLPNTTLITNYPTTDHAHHRPPLPETALTTDFSLRQNFRILSQLFTVHLSGILKVLPFVHLYLHHVYFLNCPVSHSEHRFPAPSSKLCQIWLHH